MHGFDSLEEWISQIASLPGREGKAAIQKFEEKFQQSITGSVVSCWISAPTNTEVESALPTHSNESFSWCVELMFEDVDFISTQLEHHGPTLTEHEKDEFVTTLLCRLGLLSATIERDQKAENERLRLAAIVRRLLLCQFGNPGELPITRQSRG